MQFVQTSIKETVVKVPKGSSTTGFTEVVLVNLVPRVSLLPVLALWDGKKRDPGNEVEFWFAGALISIQSRDIPGHVLDNCFSAGSLSRDERCHCPFLSNQAARDSPLQLLLSILYLFFFVIENIIHELKILSGERHLVWKWHQKHMQRLRGVFMFLSLLVSFCYFDS